LQGLRVNAVGGGVVKGMESLFGKMIETLQDYDAMLSFDADVIKQFKSQGYKDATRIL
jgi:hypothetical protein